jgi:hypothetical protein
MITGDEVIKDLLAHLVGATSAYEKHCARHRDIRPRAKADPFYLTRLGDFEKCIERTRQYLKVAEIATAPAIGETRTIGMPPHTVEVFTTDGWKAVTK